jgi:hypothetical protein
MLATSEADVARFRERLASEADLIASLCKLRGWTREAILGLGLGYDGERVVFPVRDETGLLVGVMRYTPDPASRNGPKMLAESGSVRELFPSPESVSGALLWLVEGEPDSVAAASLGVSAVAVPGASGWDSNWAARFAGRDVVLCCDCDPPGRTLARQAARDLAPVARTVRVLDLTASREDGFDIGDFVREAAEFGPEGRARARRILEATAAATDPGEPESVVSRAAAGDGRGDTRRTQLAREGAFVSERMSDAFRVRADVLDGQPEAVASAPEDVAPFALPLAEFIAAKTETPSVLIGDEHENLLPAAGLLILFAKGGRGKTTLIVDLAFHLASGRDWLGLKVPRPLRVLLIENEGPREPFREKLALKRKHWPHDMPGEIFVYTEDWGALKLGENVEKLRRFIEEHAIDVVIGDPLDSLGIKGVGSPEDTREFMELLTLVGLRRDVAFLLLHHPRKGDSDDELDEVSGAWGGRPDSLLKLDKLDGNRARLSFPKVRWSRQGNRSPLILAFEPETEAFEAVGEEQDEERDLCG